MEASLIYTASSRTSRVTQRDPVLETTIKQNKTNKTKKQREIEEQERD